MSVDTPLNDPKRVFMKNFEHFKRTEEFQELEGKSMKSAFTPTSETAKKILETLYDEVKEQVVLEEPTTVVENIKSLAILKQKVAALIDQEFPNELTELARITQAQELVLRLTESLEWLMKVLSPVTRDYFTELYPEQSAKAREVCVKAQEFLGIQEEV